MGAGDGGLGCVLAAMGGVLVGWEALLLILLLLLLVLVLLWLAAAAAAVVAAVESTRGANMFCCW